MAVRKPRKEAQPVSKGGRQESQEILLPRKGKGGVKPYKLLEPHQRFILAMVARFITNGAEIARRLADKKYAEDFGFEPVSVNREAVNAIIKKLNPETLAKERAAYLNDMGDVPLAFSKERIKELVREYDKVDKLTQVTMLGATVPMSDGRKVALRMEILDQIRREVGDDANKLAKAIGETAKPKIILMIPDNGRAKVNAA